MEVDSDFVELLFKIMKSPIAELWRMNMKSHTTRCWVCTRAWDALAPRHSLLDVKGMHCQRSQVSARSTMAIVDLMLTRICWKRPSNSWWRIRWRFLRPPLWKQWNWWRQRCVTFKTSAPQRWLWQRQLWRNSSYTVWWVANMSWRIFFQWTQMHQHPNSSRSTQTHDIRSYPINFIASIYLCHGIFPSRSFRTRSLHGIFRESCSHDQPRHLGAVHSPRRSNGKRMGEGRSERDMWCWLDLIDKVSMVTCNRYGSTFKSTRRCQRPLCLGISGCGVKLQLCQWLMFFPIWVWCKMSSPKKAQGCNILE